MLSSKKIVLLCLLMVFIGLLGFSKEAKADCLSDCGGLGAWRYTESCCSDGLTCVSQWYIESTGACASSQPNPTCVQSPMCISCPGGSQVCASVTTNRIAIYSGGACGPSNDFCVCAETAAGGSCGPSDYCGDGTCNGDETCSSCSQDCGTCGGEDDPNNTLCKVSLSSYPSSAVIGEDFTVIYNVLATTGYELRRFYSGWDRVGCIWDENLLPAGQWQTRSTEFTCPATPGTYSFRIKCAYTGSPYIGSCYSSGLIEYQRTVQLECENPRPSSVGHIRIQGPSGMIKLNLISASDVLANMGMLKVAKTAGDTNTAADLVLTTDPDASPVRMMTPYGIRSWRKLD